MADLSPNLSVYGELARPQGQMDVGSLLGLIQRSRELNTQSGIADAIRANPNDPTAAYNAAARNPNVFMGFGDVTNAIHTQQAQTELAKSYTEQVGKGIAGLYAKAISKSGADDGDWARFAATASLYHIPAEILESAHRQIVRPDGSLDPNRLAAFWNTISGGQQLPQQQYMTGQGRQETAPAATFTTGGPSGGGAGSTPGSATISTPAGAAVGAGAGQDYRADTVAARNFPQDVTPLRHIIAGLESGVITGRSTEEVNNLKNFLHTTGIDGLFGKDLSKDVVPYEELRKYMIRAADLASAGGTNDRLAAAVSGNPNAKLLTSSNLDLAKVNLALRRMQQVGFAEFRRALDAGAMFNGHPLQYEDYSNWYTKWAADQDNRAFVHDLLDANGKRRVFNTFKTDDEAKAYQDSWRAMHNNHPEIERAGAP